MAKSAAASAETSVVGWMRERVSGLSAAVIFSFLHFAVEVLADGFQAAFEEARFDVTQNHAVTGAGKDVRDAVAHGAGAEHGDFLDLVE